MKSGRNSSHEFNEQYIQKLRIITNETEVLVDKLNEKFRTIWSHKLTHHTSGSKSRESKISGSSEIKAKYNHHKNLY